MINGNENEAVKNRSHRPRHGPKYIQYEMCLSVMTVICTKQYLGNIWEKSVAKAKRQQKKKKKRAGRSAK